MGQICGCGAERKRTPSAPSVEARRFSTASMNTSVGARLPSGEPVMATGIRRGVRCATDQEPVLMRQGSGCDSYTAGTTEAEGEVA